jgi:hypothetical protein
MFVVMVTTNPTVRNMAVVVPPLTSLTYPVPILGSLELYPSVPEWMKVAVVTSITVVSVVVTIARTVLPSLRTTVNSAVSMTSMFTVLPLVLEVVPKLESALPYTRLTTTS